MRSDDLDIEGKVGDSSGGEFWLNWKIKYLI